MQVLRAGALLQDSETVLRDVELTIVDGRVASLAPAANLTAAESATLAAPGFIDAHAHLDLGALHGAVPAGGGFLEWVRVLMERRDGLSERVLAEGARRGADALLRSGTTSVVDIDSVGVVRAALDGHPIRHVRAVELIDGSPADLDERSRAALAMAAAALDEPVTRPRAAAWSPHGTHTVGDALLERLGGLRRGIAPLVTVHWAETPEEARWLRSGEGPFASWLGPSPRTTGSERLERGGLLERCLLVHGNHPAVDEPERLARAGAAVVHCPGTHAFFGRDPFPLGAYDEAGVPVLLGTDSLASNAALDMRREMRLAVETLGVSPARALAMATTEAAPFLPWSDAAGRLATGTAADVVLFAPDARIEEARRPEAVVEELVLGTLDVAETLVLGRRTR